VTDEERRRRAAERARIQRAKDPDKARASWRKWAAANPEKVKNAKRRKQSSEWSAARPWKRREYKFGLSQEAFDAILQTQKFVCASCKTDLRVIQSKNVHVDHCHATKRIRGILCHSCNTSLGLMKEDSNLLLGLISYIEGFK
jgi:hypothetical protein